MTDLTWRAIRELSLLRTKFGELLEEALMSAPSAAAQGAGPFEPPADVWEIEGEVVVEIEVPSARAEDIELKLEAGTLTVSGHLPPTASAGGHFVRVERPRGTFHRVVALPVEVSGAPSARLRQGVLEVRLPCAVPSKRRIVIEERGV
ncbi:MAG: Hsp20/alpha crystallin family protein [Acidobacteriota bacterium]